MAKALTVTELMRQRLLNNAGVVDVKIQTDLSPIEILNQEMDWGFLSEMGNGMIIGYFRYGSAINSDIDNLKEIEKRLELYKTTHNAQYLRDVANFAMQERRRPSFNDVKFEIVDDDIHGEEITRG